MPEFSKEDHLLTAKKRLRLVAQDFVRHYSDLWTSGKAMFVSYNKVTCVRMYNYVQEYWQREIKHLEERIEKYNSQQEVQEMKSKLKWMQETDMAVVVSQEQNRATIEKTFEELMTLSGQLSEEERRYVREGFKNDEELSMFDILMKDNLSKEDIKKIKKVAVELLDKIKQQLAGMDHPSTSLTPRLPSSSPSATFSGRNYPIATAKKASFSIVMQSITM